MGKLSKLAKGLIIAGSVIGGIGVIGGGVVGGAYLYGENYTQDIADHVELNDNDDIKTMKAVGRGIYDIDGSRFDIKGVNFGNWLFQEGWMTVNSIGPLLNEDGTYVKVNPQGVVEEYEEMFEDEVLAILEKRFTEEQIEELYETYYSSYCTEVDFKNIKSMGLNTIRLNMSYRNFMKGEPGSLVMKENPFKWIDWFLEMAQKYELKVILDMHTTPGGQSGYEHSGTRSMDFWTTDEYIEEFCTLWANIAERYVTERKDLASTILAFDLINEPVRKTELATGKEQWDVFDRIYDAIREVNDEHIVCFEGVWYFNNLPNPKDYGWENVMYQYHFYNWNYPSISNEAFYTLMFLTLSMADYDVPKYIGEFTFFDHAAEWDKWLNKFDSMGIGWTFWSYKTVSVGWWDSTWGLAVQKLHLENKDGVNYENDTLKLDLRTATFEEIKEAWSKEYTDDLSTPDVFEGPYRFDGNMYKFIRDYFNK